MRLYKIIYSISSLLDKIRNIFVKYKENKLAKELVVAATYIIVASLFPRPSDLIVICVVLVLVFLDFCDSTTKKEILCTERKLLYSVLGLICIQAIQEYFLVHHHALTDYYSVYDLLSLLQIVFGFSFFYYLYHWFRNRIR